MNKTLIIIVLSILLGVTSFLAIRPFFQADDEESVSILQEIKRIKELHMVTYRYEDLFFYHNRQDKGKRVVVMATVPVTTSAYFDMNRAIVEENDSSLIIRLPAVSLSEPNYQIDKMKVQTVRRFSVMAGVDLHQKMLDALSKKVAKRKAGILGLAKENGIEGMAVEQVKEYFSSLFGTLGYQNIIIKVEGDTAAVGDSIITPELIPIDGIRVLE